MWAPPHPCCSPCSLISGSGPSVSSPSNNCGRCSVTADLRARFLAPGLIPSGFLPPWNLPCPRYSNRDWAVSFPPSIGPIKSLFPLNGRAVHGGVALIPRGSLLRRDPSSPIYVADLESFSSYFLLLLANFTRKIVSESTLWVNRLPQTHISTSPLLVWCTSFGSQSPPIYIALVNR
jgi:hypothetical protein